MRMTRSLGLVSATVVAGWVFSAVVPSATLAQGNPRPAGWREATHGAKAAPDYARLFAMDKVHEIRITMTPDSFQAIQADLKAITPAMPPMPGGVPGGAPGAGGPPAFPPPGRGGLPGFGPPGPGGTNPMAALMEAGLKACEGKPETTSCSASGMEGKCTAMFGGPLMCVPAQFAKMMEGGAMSLTTRDPMYVPVSVRHDEGVWTKVGMRYKGNSTLMAANMGGIAKIPFRLDFDRYEDESPEIRNQRFYGFQKLTFSSNFSDDSQVREVIGTEILRDRGVPAARAAFYRVFIDTGAGPEYWGLYSMLEDPADGAMLDAQFGGRSGNLYKPEGPGADWKAFDQKGFEKKTNEKDADFSDVSRAIAALHAPRTNPQAWRAALEAAFDADLFLRWLAVNTAIENWDAYGVMSHNYYLYGDPARGGRLRWIPWDNNMAFGVGTGFGAPPGGFTLPGGTPGAAGMGNAGTDVLHKNVGDRWPLIQILLADEVYKARYRELLEYALGGLFAPDAVRKRARELHALIAPSVVGPQGERPTHRTVTSPEAFQAAIDGPGGLLALIEKRRALIRSALDAR